MQRYKKAASTLMMLIVLAALTAIVTLRGQNQNKSTSDEQNTRGQRDLPIVDYDAPEPTGDQERAKRRSKGKRYDKQSSQPIQDSPQASGRIWSSHWSRGLTAIPTDQSDTVLIGQVLDAQAYLSNDKTGVYSEFTILIDEVLKGDVGTSFPSRSKVIIERVGGAVRFPSGRIQRDETSGQGMPRIGCRYVLFLKRLDQDQDFSLVTGYELRGERVFPLDGATIEEGTQKFPFDEFNGFDASAFLRLVRDAIIQKPRERSEEKR